LLLSYWKNELTKFRQFIWWSFFSYWRTVEEANNELQPYINYAFVFLYFYVNVSMTCDQMRANGKVFKQPQLYEVAIYVSVEMMKFQSNV